MTKLLLRGNAKEDEILTKKIFIFCLKGASAIAEKRQSEPVQLFT